MNTTLFIVIIFFQSIFITEIETEQTNCFTKFIGIEKTEDIKQINCSESNSSCCFQMSFVCNSKTLKRIVNKLDLVRDRKRNYAEFQHVFKEYDWWKHENIKSIKQIFKSNIPKKSHISGPWIMLYYDKKNSKLYISQYDL